MNQKHTQRLSSTFKWKGKSIITTIEYFLTEEQSLEHEEHAMARKSNFTNVELVNDIHTFISDY